VSESVSDLFLTDLFYEAINTEQKEIDRVKGLMDQPVVSVEDMKCYTSWLCYHKKRKDGFQIMIWIIGQYL